MGATTQAWHPARKPDWLAFAKSLGPFFVVITVMLWICLPIFWGSNALLQQYLYRLNIFVVDFDSEAVGEQNALLGPTVVQTLSQINQAAGPHLTYQVLPPQSFPGGPEQVMEAIGHSEAWGAVVIMPNATTAWQNAVNNGLATYDPTGSLGLYYASAHFFEVIPVYVVPLMKSNVMPALSMASDMATRMFFNDAIAADNATAITTAAAAPQTIGNTFGMFTFDTRPITEWASAAPLTAGLIYNVIFTFHLVLLSAIARLSSGLQTRLKTTSLLKLRLAIPAFCYFWFSLWYVLVVRAFQVPLEASVGRAGFVVFWMLNYLTYLALGLALEALFSLLTIRWFPFALISWIILNITSSFLPIQLMQPFYRWGYAWPFRLNVEASKIIFYDTEPQSYLGRYIGGIMAWAFAGVVSVTLFQILDRWRMDRNMRKGIAAQMEKGEKGAEEGGASSSSEEHRQLSSSSSRQSSQHPSNSQSSQETTHNPQASNKVGLYAVEEGQAPAPSSQPAPSQPDQQQRSQGGPVPLADAGRMESDSGRSTYYDARTP